MNIFTERCKKCWAVKFSGKPCEKCRGRAEARSQEMAPAVRAIGHDLICVVTGKPLLSDRLLTKHSVSRGGDLYGFAVSDAMKMAGATPEQVRAGKLKVQQIEDEKARRAREAEQRELRAQAKPSLIGSSVSPAPVLPRPPVFPGTADRHLLECIRKAPGAVLDTIAVDSFPLPPRKRGEPSQRYRARLLRTLQKREELPVAYLVGGSPLGVRNLGVMECPECAYRLSMEHARTRCPACGVHLEAFSLEGLAKFLQGCPRLEVDPDRYEYYAKTTCNGRDVLIKQAWLKLAGEMRERISFAPKPLPF